MTITCTIFAYTAHPRAHGDLNADVEQGRNSVAVVREVAVRHLHERLRSRFDTFNRPRLWELELQLGFPQVEKCTGLGVNLEEVVQVASVVLQLQPLDLKDVGAAVVEEARVVGHHDGCDVFQRVNVGLHPGHVDDVQMICGLNSSIVKKIKIIDVHYEVLK